jgi:topoisomerase-4 subunit A
LISTSGGYGFLANIEHMVSRNKGGKSFVSLGTGETLCRPSEVNSASNIEPESAWEPATHVVCVSAGGRILSFAIAELKTLEKGGRGLNLIDLDPKDTLAGAAAYAKSVVVSGLGRGGKAKEETLELRSLNSAKSTRARKGKAVDLGFKPTGVLRLA